VAQISTLTFFRFRGMNNMLWGFSQMQFAHQSLHAVKGQIMYKLMGSGKGDGFNPFPDWSVYSLLQVWQSESEALDFFNQAKIIKQYRHHTEACWTIYMNNIMARGAWGGQNPFKPGELHADNPLIAVITRASIKPSKLIPFWKYVPLSQQNLLSNPGLLFTKGIGEVPFLNMATFSIWDNIESLNEYAYRSKTHIGAIQRTRDIQWYSEEMFSRFQPYRFDGQWGSVSARLESFGLNK
jgi:hypothetical protein